MTVKITGEVRDETRRGIGGVTVSNGEHITVSDTNGHYVLRAEPESHSFVFVTIPSGFRPADTFFRPVPPTSGTLNFKLVSTVVGTQPRFLVAHISDIHVVAEDEILPSEQMLPTGDVLGQDLRQLIEDTGADLVIATGDLTNRGTERQLTAVRRAFDSISVPVYPVVGNHDGAEEWFSAGGKGNKTLRPKPGRMWTRNYGRALGPSRYSFDWSDRHFVVYDSEDTFLSEEAQHQRESWLWADLSLQPEAREIIVTLHSPPSREFLEQLAAYNVRLVLHGHWHSSKVFSHAGITVAAVPSLSFGGIDTTPRGCRLVRFSEDGFDLCLKALGGIRHAHNAKKAQYLENTEGARPGGLVRIRPVDGTQEIKTKLQLWKRVLPAPVHRAAPVSKNGDLLLSLQDEDNSGLQGVYRIAGDTGNTRWHTTTDAVVKNSVVTGAENHCVAVSVTGRLYCIDIRSGARVWEADLPGFPDRWIYTSPVIADGTVYAGAKSGYGAYDLRTGARKWYTPLMHLDNWSCYASPQVYEDLLIVLVPGRGLLALNRQDGRISWERHLRVGYSYAPPVVGGDLLVSGGDPGRIVVLSAASGEILWHKPTMDATYPSGLAVEGEMIYTTTPTGEVRCLNLTSGELVWKFRCGNDLLDMTPYRRKTRSILAAPVVVDRLLLVGGCDGRLYLLRQDSGTLEGWAQLDGPVTATPCLVDKGFCIATWNGDLYRFGSHAYPTSA